MFDKTCQIKPVLFLQCLTFCNKFAHNFHIIISVVGLWPISFSSVILNVKLICVKYFFFGNHV